MQTRPYQVKAYNQVIAGMRICNKVVLELPTGSGKSVIAVQLMLAAQRNHRRVCVITERITLADQMANHCERNKINFGVIRGDDRRRLWGADVQVCTIQTLVKRPKFDHDMGFDLFIVDECHLMHKHHAILMDRFSSAKWLGLTATPWRKGLGNHWELLVNPTTPKELISDGYLSKWAAFCPPKSKIDVTGIKVVRGEYEGEEVARRTTNIYANVLAEWQYRCRNKSTLLFAANIRDSKEFTERFKRIGVRASHIDAYTDSAETRRVLADFNAHHGRVLCSVTKLSTGADLPRAEVGIIARPIRSQMLHYQMMGRLLRPYPGKERAIFLDHAGNIERLGAPDDPPHLELDTGGLSDKDVEREGLPKYCKKCGKLKKSLKCPYCGYEPSIEANINEVDGELKEYANKQRKNKFMQMLKHYELNAGYKLGWAYHTYIAFFGEKPDRGNKGKTLEPDEEVEVFIKNRILYNRIRYANRRS